MYIKRHAEDTIKKMTSMFKTVLITGARQVGKSTLLKENYKNYNYVTFDNFITLEEATTDSMMFFKSNPPPLVIDEVQYAPGVFRTIKMIVDEKPDEYGRFLMTGSQQFRLMQNVTESLAGRLGILNISGLSLRELKNDSFKTPFIPTENYFSERKKKISETDYDEIWDLIFKGCMPESYKIADLDKELFYSSYTSTYIERDVRTLSQVGDEKQFLVFMKALAARTSQILNLSSVANEIGISESTAKRWLSILETSDIVFLLKGFYSNQTKRLIKSPKIYYTDTGLASYLTKWSSPSVLRNGAMAGAFFETFVINEVRKSYLNAGKEPPIYYLRNKEKKEIDIIIVDGDRLYPVEIKMYVKVNRHDVDVFSLLDNISGYQRMNGGIICLYDKLIQINDKDYCIPVNYL